MKRSTEVIVLELDDGSCVHVEADLLGGEENVSFDRFKFSELEARIAEVTKAVSQPLKATSASRAAVEFGISAAVESGTLVACIAKGQATANLKVTLEWERDSNGTG